VHAAKAAISILRGSNVVAIGEQQAIWNVAVDTAAQECVTGRAGVDGAREHLLVGDRARGFDEVVQSTDVCVVGWVSFRANCSILSC
jgi:hypothetical protein